MASKSQVLITKEREDLTNLFIKNLEKGGLEWIKGWSGQLSPHNGTTNLPYKGGNRLKLMVHSQMSDLKDPRWVTFNQAKAKGWKIKKGAKSIPLEKWIFTKKVKDKVTKEEKIEKLKFPIANYFRVFNGADVDGIPPFDLEKKHISNDEVNNLINDLIKTSECKIEEMPQDRAYYSSHDDKIVIPPREAFNSSEECLSTLLHEMGHSTGHESRLNRPLGNKFGSVDYAKEELRAEISAVFSQNELNIELKENHIDNHSAYINSWISVLKKDPNEIYRASSDAEKITDRLIKNYRTLEKEITKDKTKEVEKTIKVEKVSPWRKKLIKDKEVSMGRSL